MVIVAVFNEAVVMVVAAIVALGHGGSCLHGGHSHVAMFFPKGIPECCVFSQPTPNTTWKWLWKYTLLRLQLLECVRKYDLAKHRHMAWLCMGFNIRRYQLCIWEYFRVGMFGYDSLLHMPKITTDVFCLLCTHITSMYYPCPFWCGLHPQVKVVGSVFLNTGLVVNAFLCWPLAIQRLKAADLKILVPRLGRPMTVPLHSCQIGSPAEGFLDHLAPIKRKQRCCISFSFLCGTRNTFLMVEMEGEVVSKRTSCQREGKEVDPMGC